MSQRQTSTGTVLSLVPETLPEHVYRRSNGKLYGCIWVDGHQIRKSLGTSDPIEAEVRVRRWLAEVSPKHQTGELTFAQVASSWIENYQSEYSSKTWKRYKTSLRMLKPHFDGIYWSDVTRSKINEFIAERRKGGATTATVNRDLAVLSNIIHHALDQEWSDENPLLHLSKRKRRERREPFVLPSDAEIEWVWRHMHGTFADLCRFALETGLRRDELVFLDMKNVLLDRRCIQLFKTKTRQVRVVELSDAAIEVAKRQKRENGYLFRTRDDEPYKSVSGMWRATVARAAKSWCAQKCAQQAFTRFRFHDLRHIYAIRYLRSGGNIYILQKQMGHSTIKQTEGYLAYLTPDEQVQAQLGDQHRAH